MYRFSNMATKRIAIIGSGNWGSTIAKIVGNNVKSLKEFHEEVRMWVYEETIDGKKLTDIINTEHENPKYLPGIKLPNNVIADPSEVNTVKDADILVFVIPHQFMPGVCKKVKGNLKKGAYAVSLIKGMDVLENGGIQLISDSIRVLFEMPCAVLMGANLAPEVARENYCEATIGCVDTVKGTELKKLFQTTYFRIVTTKDEVAVELCGALKNVVAVGAGFCEGLGYGDNTKAAIIRLGFKEMIHFIKTFYGDRGIQDATFLESCGIADLVTTCYGGRNRKIGIEFAKTRQPLDKLEKELLGGQSAQGPLTAKEVNIMLKAKGKENDYPLFTAVHKICVGELPPDSFISCLGNHPEHM